MTTDLESLSLVTNQEWDYSTLDQKVAVKLKNCAKDINLRAKRTRDDIIAIGEALLKAKDLLPHGQFQNWIVAEFEFTPRHARNYMLVAQRKAAGISMELGGLIDLIGKKDDLDNLNTFKTELISLLNPLDDPEFTQHLDTKLVALLKSPNTPKSAISEIVRRIKEGEHISYDKGVYLVRQFDKMDRDEKARDNCLDSENSSESEEYFTPKKIADIVRQFLGKIDLDPASNPDANKTIQASKYFTKKENGLIYQWNGKVFCNPPYGFAEKRESNQGIWSKKFFDEYKSGRLKEGILLINAYPGAKWFQSLMKTFRVCFVDGRIKFDTPEGRAEHPRHYNAMIYFGKRNAEFFKQFDPIIGTVVWRDQAKANIKKAS